MDSVVCKVEGCGRMARSVRSGICGTHYARVRTSGRIDLRSATERFWEKVEKTDSCWLWAGKLDPNGYGRFWVKPKTCYAHRFSYELHRGPIPVGLTIDHRCRVRNCVNPEHLEPETLEDNVRLARSANAEKVLCPRGHDLDYVNSNGGRECLVCRHARIVRDSRRKQTLVRLGLPTGIYTVDQLSEWLVDNHRASVVAALKARANA